MSQSIYRPFGGRGAVYGAADLEASFGALLTELAAALDEQGIEWMLVGGLAVGVWTVPRGTKDIDLALTVPSTARLAAALAAARLEVAPSQLEGLPQGGVVRVRRSEPGRPSLVVDLLCAGTKFEREALGLRRPTELFGVRTWVVSPDDLLLYKLIAGRPRDMADVDRLLRLDSVPEDMTRVRAWAREWEVEDRLDRALAQAARPG
jgi:hypothetical protein